MDVEAVHNVVTKAITNMKQSETYYNNISIDDYITKEIEAHKSSQRAINNKVINTTREYDNSPYGILEELREAYDLSSLSTEEIKELIQTFV
ncbi:Terminal repeat-encoded protein [Staphylococcus phage Stab21]|nr:TreT [Staphylococcus phage Stab21]VEV88844.1 Terminal repeat-encoded protein [Staphylococcus phage Stab21]